MEKRILELENLYDDLLYHVEELEESMQSLMQPAGAKRMTDHRLESVIYSLKRYKRDNHWRFHQG